MRPMSFLRPAAGAVRDGIGKPVPRKEDDRLLRGEGSFADDVSLPGQAWASMVRSPRAASNRLMDSWSATRPAFR